MTYIVSPLAGLGGDIVAAAHLQLVNTTKTMAAEVPEKYFAILQSVGGAAVLPIVMGGTRESPYLDGTGFV